MKNIDVVNYYVACMKNGFKTTNVKIAGDSSELLMNYGTCLVQRLVDDNGVISYIVNETKYSRSTSAIQTMVRGAIPSNMIAKTVTDIPMGTRSLNWLLVSSNK